MHFFSPFQEKEALAAKEAKGEDAIDSPVGKVKNVLGREFKDAVLRLLKNKLFVYNFFSSICYIFGFVGFGTFLPKFLEYNFRVSSSSSASYSAVSGPLSSAVGLLASGWLISKFKPSARVLSG